jgi:hypothetical protein
MTFRKGAALATGFVGAMALGVFIGPYITNDGAIATLTPSTYRTEPSRAATTSRQRASATRVTTPAKTPAIAPSATALQKQLQPLLNQGADMTVASQGFRNAEQFAAVAHAARNTEVPFMLLKHRVLNEGKTLVVAIRESKPDLNAEIEASRARAEARSDLARLAG